MRFLVVLAVLAVVFCVIFAARHRAGRTQPLESLAADLHGHTVCIDPGHGGTQPGAETDGIRESDLTLAIALQLRDILEDAGATVLMTRETDTDVGLEERAGMANDAGAELFVSIHQNILPDNASVHGAETWIYSAQTQDAVALASQIQSCLIARTGAEDRGIYESSGLVVLNRTQMAACLVECGFMSNGSELERLSSEQGQAQIALGIAEGVAAYLTGETVPAYAVRAQS